MPKINLELSDGQETHFRALWRADCKSKAAFTIGSTIAEIAELRHWASHVFPRFELEASSLPPRSEQLPCIDPRSSARFALGLATEETLSASNSWLVSELPQRRTND